jgi:hypothetical protein
MNHEKGLQTLKEAVEICRQLAADRPTAFNPQLALSLGNLPLRLANVGHREDGLQAIQEAVELYRQLAAERPVEFNPNLAVSFHDLSIRLADVGRPYRPYRRRIINEDIIRFS